MKKPCCVQLACLTVLLCCFAASRPIAASAAAAARAKADEYRDALKKSISANVAASPGGGRLTVQYAVIEICRKAGVPYQWDKSRKLVGGQAARFVSPLAVRDTQADKAIKDIITPLGLTYSVDDDGLYLQRAEERATAPPAAPTPPPAAPTRPPGAAGSEGGFQGRQDLKIPLEPFSVIGLDGRELEYGDFAGRILVIGVGMSWCTGCPIEGRLLSRLFDEYEDRGVSFIYANRAERYDTALDFAKYRRAPFPTALMPTWEMPESCYAGNPGVVVVDRQGMVRMRGNFTEAEGMESTLCPFIDRLLSGQPPSPAALSTATAESAAGRAEPEARVTALGWGAPLAISREGAAAAQPTIVADGAGGVWIAWTEDPTRNGEIAVRRHDGGKWLAVEYPVGDPADDYSPALACDKVGNVWLAWASNRGGNYAVWCTRLETGKWLDPVMVSRGGADSFHPGLDIDEAGQVWLTWYTWSVQWLRDTEYHWRSIYAAQRRNGKWSSPVEITPFSEICMDHWDSEVVVQENGAPLICWNQDNRNDPTIFSSEFGEGGWGRHLIVSKGAKEEGEYAVPGRAQDYSTALCRGGGGVWAFWISYTRERWQVMCARRAGGAWLAPEVIAEDVGGNLSGPSGVEVGGVMNVFWSAAGDDKASSQVNLSRRVAGKWLEPIAIVRGGWSINPAACTDGSGRIWLAWQSGRAKPRISVTSGR